MSEKWAHFTNDTSEYTNHAVTIVGYDDNYPASNFDSTTEKGNPAQPEGNGAFLIKNSWGSELNDFPTNGYRHWGLLDGQDGVPYDPDAQPEPGMRATGYFWISYYDRTLSDPEVFVFERATPGNSCYTEQMDLMDAPYVLNAWEEETDVTMANVFAAEATARLSEISFMTTVPGTTVSYAVYLLGEGYGDPEDGVLIETGETQPFEYGGYHRIGLKDPRVLARGQQYSVVIEESAEGETYVPYNAAVNWEDIILYYKSVINPGESYLGDEAGWYDLSEAETRERVTAIYAAYDLTIDNFPIKSYLEPITYPAGEGNPVFSGYLTVYNWQEGNPGTFKLTNGASKTLMAEFRGQALPESWDPSYTWVAADDSLLSVATSTPKKGSAVITGLRPGVTELLVYAGDGSDPGCYGLRVLTIVVEPGPDDTYFYELENVTVDGSPACTAYIACAENASVTAWAARYDAGGRFLGAETMELAPGELNEFTVLYNGADRIRFFVLDGSYVPVCESVESGS